MHDTSFQLLKMLIRLSDARGIRVAKTTAKQLSLFTL